MSVIDLIPHSLSRLIVTPGYEDGNGDWHPGQETWSAPEKCHAVPAGQANQGMYADGTTYTYSYTIGRLKPDCKEFHVGDRIKLYVAGTAREYQVKGFHRYQLQSKIWV